MDESEGSGIEKFEVVEILEEDPTEVAVVSSDWLHNFSSRNEREAYWPPTRSNEKVKRLTGANATPDPNTCTSWPVGVLYSADNEERANIKEETDVDYISEPSTGKRKIRPNQKYQSGEESGDSDEETVAKAAKAKRLKASYPPHPPVSFSPGTSSPACGTSFNGSRPSTSGQRLSTPVQRPSTSASGHSAANPEIHRLCEKIEEVKSEVRENSRLLRAILERLEHNGAVEVGLPDDIPALPLSKQEDLEVLDRVLQQSPAKRKQLESYFRRLSGGTVIEAVTRIMKSLVEPELAVGYNWKGQRGTKRSFCSLRSIIDVIFDAVRSNASCTTIKDVEGAIKHYLKYAYQRLPKKAQAEQPVEITKESQ